MLVQSRSARSDGGRFDPFDVVESKLTVPAPEPGAVSRTALVNRLRAAGAFPTVLVVAPAGYGKSTLLAQWAERDVRRFAWVSVDEQDDDPVLLLRHVACALDRIRPLAPELVEALESPTGSVWRRVLPRLTAELSHRSSPVVLVLDGCDRISSEESLAAVTTLIENVSPGSMVALAGRAQPKLPIAALRAAEPVLEIGAYELAFSRREAEILLRGCALELDPEAIAALLERTEGWPAGLRLAALTSHELGTGPLDLAEITGDDRYLADYFRAECLARLTPARRRFLRRASILDRLSGSLCDAVLERRGSGAELEAIEGANLFLVPLDRRREWFRFHHLFRDLLRHELDEHEAELVPVLNRRAASWYESHGQSESALGHAQAAGDTDEAARILSSVGLELDVGERLSAVEGWLGRFDDERLDRYPAAAVHGCRIHALRGRAREAERWLQAAEQGVAARRKGARSARPWIAVMNAELCPDGPERMRQDAQAALAGLGPDDAWRPSALLALGAAAAILGENDAADSVFAETAEEADRLGRPAIRVAALCERALIAAGRDRHRETEALSAEARRLVAEAELSGHAASALVFATSARSLIRRGQWDRARTDLAAADELRGSLTYALPWLAAQLRLELGHAYVTLRDRDRAHAILEELRELLLVRPRLGVLVGAAEVLEGAVAAMPVARNASSRLTPAELRLLPLLATHLSFREIGDRLFVSRNTIKTQAISVYRKLGVSSRSAAIARAHELGLVEETDYELGARAAS